MKELIDTSAATTCACANLRRTDLVVTQFYDGMLAPSGISALQFSLLCAIDTFDSITPNRLVKIIGMDRATLSRHLKVLACEEFISHEEGADQYTRPLGLTQEGQQVLETPGLSGKRLSGISSTTSVCVASRPCSLSYRQSEQCSQRRYKPASPCEHTLLNLQKGGEGHVRSAWSLV